jgi:anaerobic magnesium-protoporphyrin IX monomethyl ester cyclase
MKRISKANRVLFIVHDVYQSDNDFPLGPAYLAAVLKQAGATVEAYCMDVFHYTNEELAKHLDENHYDLIGLGFLAARFEETVAPLCKVVNAHKKDAWFVLGGHGPSPISRYMLQRTGADIVAIGEAEYTIVDLLKCKINNGDLNKVEGIAFYDKEEYKMTGTGKLVKNLDDLPFPLWEIFPMDKYTTCNEMFNQDLKTERSLDMIAGRGCTNKCNFCFRLFNGIRVRSVPNMIEEIKQLWIRYGVNSIFYQDELFVLGKTRLREFRDALKEAGLTLKFTCSARVDTFDQETLDLLFECGCQGINFGFESSSTEVLKLMDKNTSAEQNLKVLELMKSDGRVGMGLNFIWNNLGDTKETLMENVAWIKKYNTYLNCRTIRPVTPYPGSPLYYKLVQDGKLEGADDFFKRFKNSDLLLVNNTNLSDEDAYAALLRANTELILDHYNHTAGDLGEAEFLIQSFKDLYEGKTTKFRGARHYVPKEGKNV